MEKKKFKIVMKGSTAEIYIYEDIGEDWFGGLSAKAFSEEMKKIKNADNLHVYINSPGGNVFDGVSIYNQIKRHNAPVRVEIDGLAASVASLIAMAGDEIFMAENAMMMIHKPWGGVFGTADEMRQYADTLDKVQDTLLDTYVKRSGQPAAKLKKLLEAETWLNADEALGLNLIDYTTDSKQMAAHVDLSKYHYRNVPKVLPSAVYTVQPDKIREPFELRKKYTDEIRLRAAQLKDRL